MQPNFSSSSAELGKSPKRYSRVAPNVTINNIVTVDPEKFTRSPSTSKFSEDPDYERVKFIVEERAKYWRDLKVLYNDYTLVKVKQKELLDSEANYVNKHCIEETIKLSNALKLKIQSKCKDIIFITNLCGNSEVNRVVQSLADGEDIDGVLIKKQKSAIKLRKAEAERKKSKHTSRKSRVNVVKRIEEKEEEEEEPPPPPPPAPPSRRRSAVNEPKFLDSELHWCQYCNVFPPTIKKYLQHLHDESHKKKIKELKINESPWHKCLPEEQAWRTDSTDSVHVKAFNFFVPANGWFCQLCRSWMGDIHCAATHLRSYVHNMNLKNFQEKFPQWKQGWLDERSKALEKTFQGRKELSVIVAQQQKVDKKKEEESETSSEEEEEEPISRHRTSKAEMWVPNQKAFERVRKETNPTLNVAESSLVKMKVGTKKERPAFIGKMPLINRSKKIVVKELPQNTTEKIAISCEETDKLQQEQKEITEKIIRRNEEENEMKLKEFMRVAKKIKKGKKKKIDPSLIAEYFNATEFNPVVETSDNIDNLMRPPALVAQWEAEANYDYHMRQLHQYNLASQMMQKPFLLDPYHAVALHNQQYYNNTHMMSNQYENFELISREDEQVYSQYIDFQNSPSSSPAAKMFASNKTDSKDTQTKPEVRKLKKKSKPVPTTAAVAATKTISSDQPEVTKKSEEPRPSKKPSSSVFKSPKKPTHVIQKPPSLNTAASDLMPSFKETFLGSEMSTGYIASLLSSNEEVKIVCTNEPFKRRMAPSKRRRMKKKKLQMGLVGSEEKGKEDASNTGETSRDERTEEISKEEAKHMIETMSASPTTPTKPQSLKDKINSIRKKIDRSQALDKVLEEPMKKTKTVKNDESDNKVNDEKDVEASDEGYASKKSWNEGTRKYAESEESEEEGDVDKLIYYDMTSI